MTSKSGPLKDKSSWIECFEKQWTFPFFMSLPWDEVKPPNVANDRLQGPKSKCETHVTISQLKDHFGKSLIRNRRYFPTIDDLPWNYQITHSKLAKVLKLK